MSFVQHDEQWWQTNDTIWISEACIFLKNTFRKIVEKNTERTVMTHCEPIIRTMRYPQSCSISICKNPTILWFQAGVGIISRLFRWLFLEIKSTCDIPGESWGDCSRCILSPLTPNISTLRSVPLLRKMPSSFLKVLPATPKEIQTSLVCSLTCSPHWLGFAEPKLSKNPQWIKSAREGWLHCYEAHESPPYPIKSTIFLNRWLIISH